MLMKYENAIIVINKTRLELLVERFNTVAQARFYVEHSGGNFSEYEKEHTTFKEALHTVQKIISKKITLKVLCREYLPNFIFGGKDVIVVLGQDGLVANTAKYANGIPIVAINPDPERYDGVLLPFNPNNFEPVLTGLINREAGHVSVTMAEVKLNDGQRLLAFNDFYIGQKTHVSARYQLTFNGTSEKQSSSGIIISTGAGTTGWLSSMCNMAKGISSAFGNNQTIYNPGVKLGWDSRKLAFVVREPFRSVHSGVEIVAGLITEGNRLKIESFMPNNGQIFSDGIENDFINFNSGAIAEVGIAKEKAHIVVG